MFDGTKNLFDQQLQTKTMHTLRVSVLSADLTVLEIIEQK
jgi:hypothetical protein